MDRRIGTVAAYVEGEVAGTCLSCDGGVVDDDVATVIRQRISSTATQIAAVKSHLLKSQVAVVLNQEYCFGRVYYARLFSRALERNVAVFQELEAL